MNGHTPGPWAFIKGISGYSIIANGETIAYTISNGSPRGMEMQRSGTNEANARVLAAAPVLLDLIKRAVARLEIEHKHGGSIMQEWVIDARAAIAKATGEQS